MIGPPWRRHIDDPPGTQAEANASGAAESNYTSWLRFLRTQALTMLAVNMFNVDCAVNPERSTSSAWLPLLPNLWQGERSPPLRAGHVRRAADRATVEASGVTEHTT